jgi:hypothetical protein
VQVGGRFLVLVADDVGFHPEHGRFVVKYGNFIPKNGTAGEIPDRRS